MNKRNILFLVFFLSLFIIPGVLAATSEITVKTLPRHNLFITITKPVETPFQAIEIFNRLSEGDGIVNLDYESTTVKEFGLLVRVKQGDEIIYNEWSGPYDIGEDIELDYGYEGPVEIGNYSVGSSEEDFSGGNESVNTTEEMFNTTLDSTSVEEEAAQISEDGSSLGRSFNVPNWFYYVLAGLVFILAVGLIVYYIGKKKKSKGDSEDDDKDSKKKSKEDKVKDKKVNQIKEGFDDIKMNDADLLFDKDYREARKEFEKALKTYKAAKMRATIKRDESKLQKEKEKLAKLEKEK